MRGVRRRYTPCPSVLPTRIIHPAVGEGDGAATWAVGDGPEPGVGEPTGTAVAVAAGLGEGGGATCGTELGLAGGVTVGGGGEVAA